MNDSDLEAILGEKDAALDEVKRLKKFVILTEKRHRNELESKRVEHDKKSRELEKIRKEFDETFEKLKLEQDSNKLLFSPKPM